MTALVILLSGVTVPYGQAAGAELTISGFTAVYGNWVSIFTAVAMCCFAFSTIVGWGLYGARCAEFLLGSKILLPFNIAYCLIAILGATTDLGLIWSISDTFNGFMTVPNLIAIFLMTPVVLQLIREHFSKQSK
jgi:AGCS family alanine or glycine:cation symporter